MSAYFSRWQLMLNIAKDLSPWILWIPYSTIYCWLDQHLIYVIFKNCVFLSLSFWSSFVPLPIYHVPFISKLIMKISRGINLFAQRKIFFSKLLKFLNLIKYLVVMKYKSYELIELKNKNGDNKIIRKLWNKKCVIMQ